MPEHQWTAAKEITNNYWSSNTSQKKRKDSLETRAEPAVFSL